MRFPSPTLVIDFALLLAISDLPPAPAVIFNLALLHLHGALSTETDFLPPQVISDFAPPLAITDFPPVIFDLSPLVRPQVRSS